MTQFLEAAQVMLLRDEGVRLKPYKCPAGRLTIGVGRNLDDKGITYEEAITLLHNDTLESIAAASTIIGEDKFKDLSSTRQLAVINLVFNLGAAGFAKFHDTIAALRAGDYKAAGAHLRASKYFTQLPKRAERVAVMIEENRLPSYYQFKT